MESAEQGTLRLVLEGEKISPESIGVKDLNRMLRAFTEVLEVAGGDAGDVALVGIRSGSAEYAFQTASDTSALMADVIAGMGADGSRSVGPDLDAAIRKTRRSIPSHAELVIEQVYGDRVERTRLEAGVEKETPQVIVGQTTIYGLVTGVIAGKRPTARMRVVGDNRVVVMSCSVENARVFGGLILRTVRVEGIANWDIESLELQKFEVTDVEEFSPAPISESLRELAALTGDAWSGRNALDEIAFLRGEDDKGR